MRTSEAKALRVKELFRNNPSINLVDMKIPLRKYFDNSMKSLYDIIDREFNDSYLSFHEPTKQMLKYFTPNTTKISIKSNRDGSNFRKQKVVTKESSQLMQAKIFVLSYSRSTRPKKGDKEGYIDHRINISPVIPRVKFDFHKMPFNQHTNTLTTGDGCGSWNSINFVYQDGKFRYLYPHECEQLQGWPKNHTKFGLNEKGEKVKIEEKDRYSMIGNGVASDVPLQMLTSFFGTTDEVRIFSGFSGVSGLELKLPKNFKVVSSCEIDKECQSVLRNHHGMNHPILSDITKVEPSLLREMNIDIFTLGINCQAWSKLGKGLGFKDPRGAIFLDVINLIRAAYPKYVLIENVVGILDNDSGKSFERICSLLSQAGYNIDFEVVNSFNFGLPQLRERVFIFCSRKDLKI